MNTALVSLALAGIISAPSWESSYSKAQQNALNQRKPLVVVFGAGPNAWTKMVSEPTAEPQVNKLLTDQYICLYVDTSTAEGGRLAQTFAISNGRGLVISDRTGGTQAFWHEGVLPNETLARYLYKFADPNLVVTGTETVAPRVSYYPNQPVAPQMRPVNC
jgi:hypothetical protein